MAWTTPRTWAAAEVVTASLLNVHVRDNLNALSTWVSYSPTWGATGGTPSLGNGSLAGYSIQAGSLCMLRLQLVIGSTTTFAGTTVWSLSAPVAPASMAVGAWTFQDAGSGWYSGTCFSAGPGSSSIVFQINDNNFLGAALPVVPATGDRISATLIYDI